MSEKDPLVKGGSTPSVVSSKKVTITTTEEEKKSSSRATTVTKEPAQKPSFTKGIYLMLFITFLASVCFSIVLPSIWPFMHAKLDAQKSWVGWAVAVNSGGSFLASPFIGWWADKRTTKEVVAVTLIMMIIGNVMYSLSVNFYMLLAGRFIVGVAAANYAVAQTYISYATDVDNRTRIMALNSAANVLGFIIGPALALLFTVMHFNVAGISFDDYTLPGYFSALLSLFGLFSLIGLEEIPDSIKRRKQPTSASGKYAGSGFYNGGGSVKDVSQLLTMAKNQQIPILPVAICLFCYFSYTTSFTVFETIGTPYTQEDFNWGVTQNSILYAVLGGVCIFSLVILQLFVSRINDRVLVAALTTLLVAGFSFYFNLKNHLVGFAEFCIGVALCAAGYSTATAVLISIYSKVLEGFDQGMLMGWLSSAGSIARIVGPVFASYAFQYGGPRLVFGAMVGLTAVTFIVLLFSFRALAPRDMKAQKEKEKLVNPTV